MGRGQIIGALLCLVAVGVTILFIWGLSGGAYWAIAIPIALLVIVSMTLLFWVGWTFITTEMGPPEPPGGPEGSRR